MLYQHLLGLLTIPMLAAKVDTLGHVGAEKREAVLFLLAPEVPPMPTAYHSPGQLQV